MGKLPKTLFCNALAIALIGILLAGCKETPQIAEKPLLAEPLKDQRVSEVNLKELEEIPQNVAYFLSFKGRFSSFESEKKRFESLYFKAWNLTEDELKKYNLSWAFDAYKEGESYAENYALYTQKFFDEMRDESNMAAYASLNKKAVVTTHADMRVFPTERALLKDPDRAGEGFPFDYLQNSTISANEPVLVTHYSKSKEWVHIVSSFALGWVKSDQVAFVEDSHAKKWQEAKQVKIVKENQVLYDANGRFLMNTRIGMNLPLIKEKQNSYIVLVTERDNRSVARYSSVEISKDIGSVEFLEFNQENISMIFEEVTQSIYGWGGIYGQRDCSSTLRDIFAPFGIWLPRNSYDQAQVGNKVDVTKLDEKEKEAFILKEAVPFETLLYKSGHIGLYVGEYGGRAIMFHNTWGIKTKKDGQESRIVVGKGVFTTLQFGSEIDDYKKEDDFLKNIESINTLGR